MPATIGFQLGWSDNTVLSAHEGEAGIVKIRLGERVLDPNRPFPYSFQRRRSTL